ncbi:MAG: cytochrome [Hydrocarboniphaga sp.]|uniref:cytochrome P450 n=1 Tax=Hydrocarboniphaga sp. TaxID=2033016 RepID=UPI00260840CA|nr:cytochrome P450 [Hydrocarboniphaga sp.]MDB5971576.1 cytochrome [Hydrocarboniphaga sp.]
MAGTAQAGVAAPIPDHVPPELVYDARITEGAEFLAAPHKFMAELHQKAPPIFFSPGSEHQKPAWQLLKYEDAYFVLRHPEFFTSAGSGPFPRDPNDWWNIIPLEIEPPHHRKYRAIVDPLVSPKTVMTLELSIRKLANDLIDQFIDKGECEFAKDFGRPLPVGVFLDIMSLPRSMMDEFVRWAMGLLHAQDRQIAQQVMGEVTVYLNTVIREKAAHPDGGAVSAIVHGKPGGEPMSGREIFGFVFFLFIAGLDTVFATLNNIFVWLAENPERRQEIIDSPGNIDNIVEELLRVFSVTFSGRTLTQDYEIRGVKMKKGDRVTSILPSCNYDPEIFPDPTDVNFNRPRKPILAFAGGVHSCMGAHLARMEVKICLQEFLRRIPNFTLKPGTRIEYYPGGVVGPKSVPLAWR